jgi:hypothetical protein
VFDSDSDGDSDGDSGSRSRLFRSQAVAWDDQNTVDAVVFEAAVAEDLPGLLAGEGVLDAGANSLVRAAVFLSPGRSRVDCRAMVGRLPRPGVSQRR